MATLKPSKFLTCFALLLSSSVLLICCRSISALSYEDYGDVDRNQDGIYSETLGQRIKELGWWGDDDYVPSSTSRRKSSPQKSALSPVRDYKEDFKAMYGNVPNYRLDFKKIYDKERPRKITTYPAVNREPVRSEPYPAVNKQGQSVPYSALNKQPKRFTSYPAVNKKAKQFTNYPAVNKPGQSVPFSALNREPDQFTSYPAVNKPGYITSYPAVNEERVKSEPYPAVNKPSRHTSYPAVNKEPNRFTSYPAVNRKGEKETQDDLGDLQDEDDIGYLEEDTKESGKGNSLSLSRSLKKNGSNDSQLITPTTTPAISLTVDPTTTDTSTHLDVESKKPSQMSISDVVVSKKGMVGHIENPYANPSDLMRIEQVESHRMKTLPNVMQCLADFFSIISGRATDFSPKCCELDIFHLLCKKRPSTERPQIPAKTSPKPELTTTTTTTVPTTTTTTTLAPTKAKITMKPKTTAAAAITTTTTTTTTTPEEPDYGDYDDWKRRGKFSQSKREQFER